MWWNTLHVAASFRVVNLERSMPCDTINRPLLPSNSMTCNDVHHSAAYCMSQYPIQSCDMSISFPNSRSGLRSSGVHSNGYSLVRKCVEKSGTTGTGVHPPLSPFLSSHLLSVRPFSRFLSFLLFCSPSLCSGNWFNSILSDLCHPSHLYRISYWSIRDAIQLLIITAVIIWLSRPSNAMLD